MRFTGVLFILSLLILSCRDLKKELPPPLVDGNLDDFHRLGIAPIRVTDSVMLCYIFSRMITLYGSAIPTPQAVTVHWT